ncbi:MAG TPA: protein disulfide oxidoreductase [Gallionella sp.]|nr:protein disulfide oxidoreductase [Gallionella sp.]
MRKPDGLLKNTLVVLLFVVAVAGIRAWQQRDMASCAVPALQGITLAGQPYTLPAHPAKPVLVHFWAAWCPVCRAEQGSIAAIAHDHPETITVAMQSGRPEEVARHMREQGIDFQTMNDADGRISRAWGVHAVPASFIVAPDGEISFVEVGYTTEIGLRLRLWLAGLV